MFGFIKNALAKTSRDGLVNDFHKARTAINNADRPTQAAIAAGLNMTTTLFYKKYGGPQGFSRENRGQRIAYLKSLNDFEEKMRVQDPLFSLGVAVFKMWVAALAEDDNDLRMQIEPFLYELSKLAPGM